MKSTNDEEKVEIIKPKSKKKIGNNGNIKDMYNKNRKILSPIIMGIVGLILLTNSDNVIILACYAIGGLILGFGIYNIIGYSQLKKELHVEDTNKMNTGIIMIATGIFIIILASFLKTFLNLVLGIWLISTGVMKLLSISKLHNSNKRITNIYLIEAVIVIAMGLYSILFQNIILTIIGAWMIIYSAIEIYNNLKR